MNVIPVLVILAVALLAALVAAPVVLRKNPSRIAYICIGMALVYEAVGMVMWTVQLAGLAKGTTIEIRPTIVSLVTAAGKQNLISGGLNSVLIATSVGIYLLCAATVITMSIMVMRDYQRERTFNSIFHKNLQRLALVLVAGGILTLLTQVACEATWALTFDTRASMAAAPTASNLPNGAAWIVPGVIIMLLPAVVKRGMEMKDEVDYLV